MPYNFVTDNFRTKNFVADFLQAKCDFRCKTAVLRSRVPPPFGALEATYDDHLGLIGKCVVDFLLVLRQRRYERLLVKNWRFRSNGPVDTKCM